MKWSVSDSLPESNQGSDQDESEELGKKVYEREFEILSQKNQSQQVQRQLSATSVWKWPSVCVCVCESGSG